MYLDVRSCGQLCCCKSTLARVVKRDTYWWPILEREWPGIFWPAHSHGFSWCRRMAIAMRAKQQQTEYADGFNIFHSLFPVAAQRNERENFGSYEMYVRLCCPEGVVLYSRMHTLHEGGEVRPIRLPRGNGDRKKYTGGFFNYDYPAQMEACCGPSSEPPVVSERRLLGSKLSLVLLRTELPTMIWVLCHDLEIQCWFHEMWSPPAIRDPTCGLSCACTRIYRPDCAKKKGGCGEMKIEIDGLQKDNQTNTVQFSDPRVNLWIFPHMMRTAFPWPWRSGLPQDIAKDNPIASQDSIKAPRRLPDEHRRNASES